MEYPDGGIVATGHGAYEVGGRTDANAAIKMSAKCALVAATINVGALRDLFTQDIQPMAAPEADPNAPKAPTRSERTMNPAPDLADALNALTQHYKRFIGREVTRAEFSAWAAGVLRVKDKDFSKLSNWSMDCIAKCEDELNV